MTASALRTAIPLNPHLCDFKKIYQYVEISVTYGAKLQQYGHIHTDNAPVRHRLTGQFSWKQARSHELRFCKRILVTRNEVRVQIGEWPALRVKKETSSDACDLQSGIFHIRV